MRILFLSTWYPYPADNGSKIRVYHLLQALGRKHEVSLVAFSFNTARPELGEALDSFCSSVETIAVNPFVANRTSAVRRFLARDPVVTRPVPDMTAAVQRHFSLGQYEAVIASGAVMATYLSELPAGRFRALEEHNCLSSLMHERVQRARNPLERLHYWASWQKTRRYERRLFDSFDLVTMVSEQDRAYGVQVVGAADTSLKVVPNGVDCEANRPGLAEPAHNRLIYSGALSYSANFDAVRYFLRDIYPRVKVAIPQVSFRVTGSTTGVNVGDLLLDESTVLTGYVDDIRTEVAGATICVIPLREGGGTRLKILEAMALGTPVVSTSKGAQGLAVKSGVHLIIADEPGDFANQTVTLLRDQDLRNRLAKNGRRLVEAQYDWRSIGQTYADLIECAAQERSGE